MSDFTEPCVCLGIRVYLVFVTAAVLDCSACGIYCSPVVEPTSPVMYACLTIMPGKGGGGVPLRSAMLLRKCGRYWHSILVVGAVCVCGKGGDCKYNVIHTKILFTFCLELPNSNYQATICVSSYLSSYHWLRAATGDLF